MEPVSLLEYVRALPADMRLRIAQRAAQQPTLLETTWQVQSFGELLNHSTRGLFRVAGQARDAASTLTWSAVLKVVGASPHAPDDGWKREPLVYQSGLLDKGGGGLRAPRCLGVEFHQDDTAWIWLEDLADHAQNPWPLERYGLAARHLGQFNGVYLVRRPVPALPWLRTGGMASYTYDAATLRTVIEDQELWESKLAQEHFGASLREQLRHLEANVAVLSRPFAHLPRTLCHLDAAHFNLFAQRTADGHDETVAIDWAMLGLAALGEEISVLIWPSVMEFCVDIADAGELENIVLDGYLAGLRDIGWAGDARQVRFAATAHALLRWVAWPYVALLAGNQALQVDLAQFFGRPLEEIVERAARVTDLLLERLSDTVSAAEVAGR